MKIRFADATGCPFGQFVVYAETEEEKAIMRLFLKGMEGPRWKFWLHGYSVGSTKGETFNFGWIENEEIKKAMKPETLRAIAGTCCIIATIAVCAFAGIKSRNDRPIAEKTERCGKIVGIVNYVSGFTLAPGAKIALEEDENKRIVQLDLGGVWALGMRACGKPL